ncbi:MAG: hypothetical protein QM486_08225, partial [Flavobacteriaceae bacterium]
MPSKNIFIFPFIVLLTLNLNAQKLELPFKFGKIKPQELSLKYYAKDSTATAVILYEKGQYKLMVEKKNIYFLATYYYKIKIFKKNSYELATVSIPLIHTKKKSEKVFNIKGITHNLENNKNISHKLEEKYIFKTKVSELWNEVRFTLPNVKEGSIIEYSYSIKTPFWNNFKGWVFQADIPKVYSELQTQIPVNWVYNREVKGYKKLDRKEEKFAKKCFTPKQTGNKNGCLEGIYAMKDIPAFKEEIYLTSKYDYLYRIEFSLKYYFTFDLGIVAYTSSWKSFDYFFNTKDELGSELKKIKYTKKLLPKNLFNEKDSLTKAKNIYHYIQNYFSNKEDEQIFRDINLKNAFKTKVGKATEINLALTNALKAAGLNSYYVLLSTRSNGIPSIKYPVISDYNYALCALKINDRLYFLDASIKLIPFGLLPFETLNSIGRVLDMKNGSYWRKILGQRNTQIRNIKLKLENNVFKGLMRIVNNTYDAFLIREFIENSNKDDYKEFFENNSGIPNLKIESFRLSNLDKIEKPLIEDFKINFELDNDDDDLIVINPYFNTDKSNPFSLKERFYPVDFGYPQTDNFRFTLSIPKDYSINSLPKEVSIKMDNNVANISSKVKIFNNNIII